MTDATLITTGKRPAVRLERRLPDPPPVVWRALTDPDQLRSWFPCDVILEGGRWEVGASITFPFPPEVIEMTLSGEVLTIDEPNAPRRLQRPKTANRAPPVGVRERSKPSRRRDEDNREEVVYGREAR